MTWIYISCSIVCGFLIGFLVIKLPYVGGCLLSGLAGFCIALLLNITVMYLASSQILVWVTNCVCLILGIGLGWKFFNKSVIGSTSLIGSYLAIRGVGLMATGFPNEYVLLKLIESDEIQMVNPSWYGYLTGIIILTIICTFVQTR